MSKEGVSICPEEMGGDVEFQLRVGNPFRPDHRQLQKASLPSGLHGGKLPSPHQTWCTASAGESLKGVPVKHSDPPGWSRSSNIAFLALVPLYWSLT